MSTALLPTTVNAAEYTSNGAITFEADPNPTNPVDPTDPEKPVDPVDPTDPDGPNPGTAGPLSIDFASSFQFGNQLITSETKDYYAQLQEFTAGAAGPNYVQVTDKRGTQEGWSLSVVQNGQFKTAEDQELTAAQIRLTKGTVVTPSLSPKPSNVSTTITLNPNGAQSLVMSAQDGEGAGTYLMSWGDSLAAAMDSIELEVPGSTTKYASQYNTTFTWLLTDTPTNP